MSESGDWDFFLKGWAKPISILPEGFGEGSPIYCECPPLQCQKIFLPADIGSRLLPRAVLLSIGRRQKSKKKVPTLLPTRLPASRPQRQVLARETLRKIPIPEEQGEK